MPKYRISGAYWDGTQLHPAGSVLEFEADPPPRSKLLEEPKPAAKAAPKKE